MKSIRKWQVLSFAAAVFIAVVGVISAQNSAIKRTVVYKGDVSVPGREAVIAQVEIAPGGRAGRHTHPGDEISYVIEGEGELLIDGQPPAQVQSWRWIFDLRRPHA